MENERDYKEEFVKNMKQLEELQKLSKEDSRPDKRDKKEKRLRELAYKELMLFKDDLTAKGYNLSDLSPESLKNNKELFEIGINAIQRITDESSADMLTKNLEDVLAGAPKGSLEELVLQKSFVENADEKLVEEYQDVLALYQNYFRIRELIEKYKNGEKLDPEKEEPILYKAIATEAAERIKSRLKKEGFSEDMQRIGERIAVLTAKYIERDTVLKNADKIWERAKDAYKKYETDKGKKIVDYATRTLDKLAKDENPEKFNLARNLVYHAVKQSKKKDNIIEYPATRREAA